MLTVVRWLVKLIKKDHQLLSNYERSHPHFIRYVGLDALLSVAIVLGGYHFIAPTAMAPQKLLDAGTVAMSADKFVNHIKDNHVDAYWLGPVPGYEYTINHEVPGIADIFYFTKAAGQPNMKVFLYEVKTYKNRKVWDAHGHSLLATANITTITINKNLSIRINRASMRGEIATLGGRSEIVAMAYPTPQSLATMIENAKRLKPIQ